MMVSCANETLTDMLYFADLAGISASFYATSNGVGVVASGGPAAVVSDTLVKIVETAFNKTFLAAPDANMFARHSAKKYRALQTAFEGQPSELGVAEHQHYFSAESHSGWREAHAFAPSASYEGFQLSRYAHEPHTRTSNHRQLPHHSSPAKGREHYDAPVPPSARSMRRVGG